MKKILITGFTPFGGEDLNPSYEAVKQLPNQILDYAIIKKEIKTSFHTSHEELILSISEVEPDAIILVGQAGGYKNVRIERVAINIADATILDNDHYMPHDQFIINSGLPAFFSTLPIKKIVENLMDEGIPAVISNSAGTFVCNHLMYHMLHYLSKINKNIPAGFIHVPYIFSQVIDKPNTYATDLNTLTNAIEIAIKTTIKEFS